MDGILNIFQTLSEVDPIQLPNYLSALAEHQCFRQMASSELDVVTSHLTNLLNNFATKHQGLLLLNTFLPQCSLDVFEQKGSLWISICTKICAQRKPVESVTLSYDVLEKLILKSINVSAVSKDITNNLLLKILEVVPTTPPVAVPSALKFLETAMRIYPGTSSALRTTTEKFILGFVDSVDESLVKQSARCLQLLQQVRGSSLQGSTHKAAWRQLQLQVIGSIHDMLDALYMNTEEVIDGFEHEDRLKIDRLKSKDEPINRVSQLVTRFRNLCTILEVILTEPFSVPKLIQPGKIMSVISRGLAVNCMTLSNNLITDNVALGALLPQIHVTLFGVLDGLIVVLKTNMLLHARDVYNLVLQSLKWTASGQANGFKRPYESIRKAAYQTLNLWCRTTKYGSQVESIVDDLVKQILQDIVPFQNEVTLKVLSGSKKHISKKARQKLHKAQNDATNLAQTHSKVFNPHNTKIIYTDEGNESLCCAALNCLAQVLLSCGCFIKPTLHKMLQEEIVLLAISVVKASNLKANLYDSADCRLGLFGALNALVNSPHHLCPPPLQYAAIVFNLAHTQDVNSNVRTTCGEYTRNIEKILHPQKEMLNFPLDLNEIRDAIENGIYIDDEDDEDEMELDENDGDEHEEKGNTTNESDCPINWTHTQQFLVADLGEVVELESTQVSFEDDDELTHNDHFDQNEETEPQHIEQPIKNSENSHLVDRPAIEDDGLGELEEVSDLELDNDDDEYYDDTVGIVNTSNEDQHLNSPNSSKESSNGSSYDEPEASQTKRQKLNLDDDLDFGSIGEDDNQILSDELDDELNDELNDALNEELNENLKEQMIDDIQPH